MKPKSSKAYLLDVAEDEGRVAGHSVLGLKALLLLAGANNLTSFATLLNGDDLNLLVSSGTLQTTNHLSKYSEFIEGQLALKDVLGGLTALNQTALQALDEGHGLLHLTQLANLGIKLLVVDRDIQGIESLTHEVDILLLPSGILLGGEDSELLRLAGVESRGLALGQLLGEVALGRQDAGSSAANVGLGGRELVRGLRYFGEFGEVNSLGLY